jgi:glycosyltransferase involved in cell wall biosynthesis
MILGINASRARSGGAKAHLIGILTEGRPSDFGFTQVHVWGYRELLDALPDCSWLIKHCPRSTEKSILHQLWWEQLCLPSELTGNKCDILFNVDAGTVCRFKPNVTMSRDMLSYESGEINRYGFSRARLRLLVLRWVQNASLRRADGAIFLTRYAGEVIQNYCGIRKNVALIPHGIGEAFRNVDKKQRWPYHGEREIECLYVSNAAPYKHQWHVVRAIELLRNRGYAIRLTLIGGGEGPAQARLAAQMDASDPSREFVTQLPFIAQKDLPKYFSGADLFIFASSCENMPNTLLEAMAAGLPIACSDRGPMPEVLENAGVYFNPEDPCSIFEAVREIVENQSLRLEISRLALERSRLFSWSRCAKETWRYLANTCSAHAQCAR